MGTRAPLGFGVGLRPKHYTEFLESSPRVDWVEAISENFMGVGGRPLAVLERVRRERPVVLHGVSLGIASAAPLDERYLAAWKALVERVQPALVSDHLCWGRAHGRYSHDLLPVPFTEEAVRHVVERVQRVQDVLGRRIALENVSSYLTFAQSELTEWEFLREVVTRADCDVLLDVNNIFVSARNHAFDPDAYLAAVPAERVAQIHLAGHLRRPELIIDTHDGPVSDEVWELYARALARFGPVSTLIEWDDGVPPLETLLAEAEKARAVAAGIREGEMERSRPADEVGWRSESEAQRRTRRGAATLATTQHLLFDAITDAAPVTAAAEALIAPHPPLSAKARIEVYAEMYWLRTRDALRETFLFVRQSLGDETFDANVADFLRGHPSTHFSLDRRGEPFPAYLRTHHPELADAAALEWARFESFLAEDAPAVGFDALQAIPPDAWPEVALAAHPSVRVLSLTHDASALLKGEPSTGPTHVVTWRQGLVAYHANVSEAEAAALRALVRGASLPELLAPFEAADDGGASAFTALQSWFVEGMVRDLSRLGSDAPRDDARAD